MKTKLLRILRKKVEKRISATVTRNGQISEYEIRWAKNRACKFYNNNEAFDFLQKKEHDLLRDKLDMYRYARFYDLF